MSRIEVPNLIPIPTIITNRFRTVWSSRTRIPKAPRYTREDIVVESVYASRRSENRAIIPVNKPGIDNVHTVRLLGHFSEPNALARRDKTAGTPI